MEKILQDIRYGVRLLGKLPMVLGAVALLLQTACANLANLTLSRAATPEREMNIRSALGAKRQRIARKLLFGVGTEDFGAFSAVSVTLLVSALFACCISAQRAAKAETMVALRYE